MSTDNKTPAPKTLSSALLGGTILHKVSKIPKTFVLTGMMGCGKTALGRVLAKKTKRKFLDLDSVIEEQISQKISEIFDLHGEATFRKIEYLALEQVLKDLKKSKTNAVLSLGGGTFISQRNRNLLSGDISIFVNTSLLVLRTRLKNDIKRPLVPQLETLLKKRLPLYKKANLEIEVQNFQDKLDTVNLIIKMLAEYE